MQPLEGLLVVSIEQAVAAPFCSARLAQAGARIIKVERSEGDFARGYDTAARGESSYFTWLNQGKESICLNFKLERDANILWSMVAEADVVIQNLSPGALARAGFTIEKLQAANPRLIICNVSGYGDNGPGANMPAYDLLVQAESGLVSVSGSPEAPGRIGVSVCDIGAGMTAYSAILEALIKRDRTGSGEILSVSLFDVAADWMSVPYLHAKYGKGAPKPAGLRHPSIAPYGAFACSDDRLVLISIQNEREWQRLCEEVLQSNDLLSSQNYVNNNLRVENRDQLEIDITAITRTMTAEEFQKRLQKARIAAGSINTADELSSHVAFRSRTVTTAEGQTLQMPAHPVVHRDGQAPQLSPTPELGEHSEALRREFKAPGAEQNA